jgi:isoquinoline 1-oxidoreductase beta subunit
MTKRDKHMDRRAFLKVSSWVGGGLLIRFDWLGGALAAQTASNPLPPAPAELNSYIRIATGGTVTLMSPNPEFGSNVITSMPMILAEELDVDWKDVVVEQADFLPTRFDRQFTGGSQAIRQGWKGLRMAGATARRLLVEAAAQTWQVPVAEITTELGVIHHKSGGRRAGYGEMAALAATLPVPKDVKTKDVKDFKIIGTSRRNVEGVKIVTGKPLFTIDHRQEGMLLAMAIHPPAFGMRVKSFDAKTARAMPGIRDVFVVKTLEDGYERNAFDTTSFTELVAVVGRTTWEVMQARKAVKVTWEKDVEKSVVVNGWSGKQTVKIPAGLESTTEHLSRMAEASRKPGKVPRRDGDPESAFRQAAKVIERTYTAPFLSHNTMEPVNCFAHVTPEKAELYGPIQAPESIMGTLVARLKLPREKIQIRLARMGGGFGQRAYGHHLVEAAVISQKLNAPVKLVYTREDDMTYGIYRPTYSATFRAALDADNRLLALHVKAGGIPESPLHANRFPAGALDNYLAESWEIESNITIGAFRAPRSNFMASAEQCFLDELAEAMGKDPIDLRLEWLDRAARKPVGRNNEYDAARYAGVLRLLKEKSGWGASQPAAGVHRGVSAYFCHNTYVAELVELAVRNGKPVVEKVVAAVDCGIVVNRDAAINMAEGGIVDGIGNALYGEMTFQDGKPAKDNFHTYRMIRHSEAPKKIEVHFVENQVDPTGLGEPLFPPIFAALANAMYQAKRKRFYTQPFLKEWEGSV